MPLPWVIIVVPWVAALALAVIGRPSVAARANIAFSAISFLLASSAFAVEAGLYGWLHLDPLNLPLLVVSFAIGLTTAIYSAALLPAEALDALGTRAYHVAFQVFMGAQALALLADNLVLLWVGMEIALISSVVLVAVQRTPASMEAAWKFFLFCGAGLAVALLGSVLLYLAAQPLLGETGLSWQALRNGAQAMDAALLNLAFVFLLVGYGTMAGLVPLHSWLPDAHAEGPTAVSAVLSGLLLNAALHAVLRAKTVVATNTETLPTGPFLIAFGLASTILAALALWRHSTVRRLFAWSSIGHMGLAVVAFGIGGAATLAGMLHMIGHAVLISAVCFGIGQAVSLKGSQRVTDITGLAAAHPALGWGLALAIAGLAGLPPSILFASQFGVLFEAVNSAPWIMPPLALAVLTAAVALVTALQSLCLGPASPDLPGRRPAPAAIYSLWLHLAGAAILGLAMPAALAGLLRDAAGLIR